MEAGKDPNLFFQLELVPPSGADERFIVLHGVEHPVSQTRGMAVFSRCCATLVTVLYRAAA